MFNKMNSLILFGIRFYDFGSIIRRSIINYDYFDIFICTLEKAF